MISGGQGSPEVVSEREPSLDLGVRMQMDFATAVRFGFLIHDVSRLRRIVIDRALKPVGITRSQWWVLSFLGRRDGMTQTALAADLDLTKVAVGGLLDRMQSADFIERRPDLRDGRIRRVFLTPAGTRFLATIRVNIEQVEQEILVNVREEDFQTSARTMRQIKKTLRAISGSDEAEE